MKPVYDKPPLTLPEQIEHLQAKGVVIADPDRAMRVLARVGLYRFKGFLLPYKSPGGYRSVGFEEVEALMALDEALRVHILLAMPLVEVGIRQTINGHMLERHGLRWYANAELFAAPGEHFDHAEFLSKALGEFHRMHDLFVRHYRDRYDQSAPPPAWMITETMTLGNWSKLFEAIRSQEDRDAIAAPLGIKASTLASWLHALTVVRNVCAHHSRLYDRRFNSMGLADDRRTKGRLRRQSFDERDTDARRLAPRLYALHRLTQALDPHSPWTRQLQELLSPCTPAFLAHLGFRPGWSAQPEWEARRGHGESPT